MKRIMLVDDDNDILRVVKMGLERRGLVVDAFDDPEKALESFRPDAYDLAILDIRMPKMNGFQLYREIFKRDANVKVRFFTAFEEFRDEFRKAFPELDERRFIKKPATLNAIAEEVLTDLNAT